MSAHLQEWQIYRIDHFLGKEPAMDIRYIRFSNSIIEPLWNRDRIEAVQITMAENFGVEDRGHFYDPVGGALRDVVQNHLLQLIGLIAAEPSSGGPDGFRDKRVELFKKSIRPADPQALCPRPVRRVPGGRRCRARLADRDLHGAEAVHRQLALVGCALLHPGRQGSAGARHRDSGDLQAPAGAAVFCRRSTNRTS